LKYIPMKPRKRSVKDGPSNGGKDKCKPDQSTLIPEDPTMEHASLYFIYCTDSKRRELIGKCLDLCMEVRNHALGVENSPVSFSRIRYQLPFALALCRIPAQWNLTGETGATEFISDLMAFVQTQIGPNLQLSLDEISHLHAICMLCSITDDYVLGFEVVDRILCVSGRRLALEYLNEEVRLPRPGRGHVVTKLKDIVVGETSLLSTLSRQKRNEMFQWVTEAEIVIVCEAIAYVLSDVKSSDESNGWCYSATEDIVSIPKWTNIAIRIILEPARSAYLRNQVFISHHSM
jgi:hypothetical protein